MSDPPNANETHRVTSNLQPFDLVPRWLRELGPHPYLTYAALVSFHGDRGCFPCIDALAERAMLSPRATKTALRALEDAGAISIERRRRRNGNQAASRYHLLAATRVQDVHSDRVQDVHSLNENQVDLEPDPLSGAIAPDADTSSPSIPDERKPSYARTREADADVAAICLKMQQHVTTLTGREPTITVEWRRHARLMLDNDGVTLDVALRAIQWLSSPGRNAVFWSKNVLSVPTLRTRMPQLHLAAQEDRQRRNGSHGQPLDHVARARQMLADRQAGA